MFTTAAPFAEGEQEIEEWFAQGWEVVDMETATTLAVAEYFGMESLAIHFAFDNPRRQKHLLLSEPKNDHRRSMGNERMIQMALSAIRDHDYLRRVREREARQMP